MDDCDEIWKMVPDWPEYEVSNLGRVRRCKSGHGAVSGKILKPYGGRKWGHLTVNLCCNGKLKVCRIHRLVAAAFLTGDTKLEVCHGDGNPKNNRVSNLRYDTRKGNSADAIRHGTTPKGQRNGNNRYSSDTIKLLKMKLKAGVSVSECHASTGIPSRYIYSIRSGKVWAWLD